MSSHLSSLLVRDGLIEVHRMEHVFQRQVIRGGSLDTILLEMGLVDDRQIQQYLSLATGLPPLSVGSSKASSQVLQEICNQDMAKRYGVVPVDLKEGALSVLVCDPVDVEQLEALADELDMSVKPMIVPEYELRVRFAAIFGGEADKRFSELAENHTVEIIASGSGPTSTLSFGERREKATKANAHSATKSVDGDTASVPKTIEPESTKPANPSERIRGKRPPAETPKRRLALKPNSAVSPQSLDEASRPCESTEGEASQAAKSQASSSAKVSQSQAAQTSKSKAAQTSKSKAAQTSKSKAAQTSKSKAAQTSKSKAAQTSKSKAAQTSKSKAAQTSKSKASQGKARKSEAGKPKPVRARTEIPSLLSSALSAPELPTAQAQPSIEAITPDEARSLLSECDDRDEIFVILLRALRKRARFTSLFTLKGDAAVGRVALGREGIDNESIRNIRIPLNVPSRFQQVVASKAFSVGSLESDDDKLREALCALGGGEVPSTALLLPIVMGSRLIAIAVAHNQERGVSVGSVTELLPLGTATADAVSRLLATMRAKKKGTAGSLPKVTVSGAKGNSTRGIARIPVPVANAEMSELFSRIEDDDPDVAQKARAEAMENLGPVLTHLQFGFPGKLRRPRNATDKRLRAAEHGPVLALVIQIGPRCGPALAEKMRDADREVRYYATICASELRPNDVLNELVERLFDSDENIRALSVEALEGYPREALHTALDFARKALHSEDNPRVKLAAEGLTKLSDTSAIPDLIDAHSRGGNAAEVSKRALFYLANQDFGGSTRRWKAWWEENKNTHRITWMLGGLSHKNTEIRKNASETLRKVTGEYFGYGHDLPKKERDKTRALWEDWWEETGKARFL